MTYLKTFYKYEIYLVVLIIILLQLLLGVQGFDVCDDGFVLTFYQQIYNAPSSVEYNFVYWLSGVVGGVWYELNPQGGVFWFKIFTVFINTVSFIIAYHVFKQFIPKRIAVLGLFVALFVNDYGFLIYYHNHLTALLALLSVLFLMKGLSQNKMLPIVISGCIIGLNVFTRIPNITLFVFVLAIPFYNYFKGAPIIETIKLVVLYILGILLGFIIIWLLLLSLGQLSIMVDALFSLFHLGGASDSGHNLGGLINTYLKQYKFLVGVISQILMICMLFLAVLTCFKYQIWLRNILLIVVFGYTFLWFKEGGIFAVYAMAYLGSLFILFTKQDVGVKTLAFLGVLMLTFLPLGSGGAINSSGYMCIWLALPFYFYFISNLKTTNVSWTYKAVSRKVTLESRSFKMVVLLTFIAFFSAKALNLSRGAYFDPGSRFEKTFTINSELAKGIYTTEERAGIINDLLPNLKKYIDKNDYLLVYDKAPMLYFLTETKPYMYNSWVWIYDSATFQQKLNKAEKEIKVYPTVVVQKFETIRYFSEPIPNYLSENLGHTEGLINDYDANRNKSMNAFLRNNDYKIVWSNAYFDIFETKKHHD